MGVMVEAAGIEPASEDLHPGRLHAYPPFNTTLRLPGGGECRNGRLYSFHPILTDIGIGLSHIVMPNLPPVGAETVDTGRFYAARA